MKDPVKISPDPLLYPENEFCQHSLQEGSVLLKMFKFDPVGKFRRTGRANYIYV